MDADESLLVVLQEAGVTPDRLALLHLAPLVEVAWAEGEVTRRERELILAMAERRGAEPGDPVHTQLKEWLDADPGAEFLDRMDRGTRALLDTLEPVARDAARTDLLKCCTLVAEAAGGILGMAAVSPEERQALEHITSWLTEKQQTVAGRAAETNPQVVATDGGRPASASTTPASRRTLAWSTIGWVRFPGGPGNPDRFGWLRHGRVECFLVVIVQ